MEFTSIFGMTQFELIFLHKYFFQIRKMEDIRVKHKIPTKKTLQLTGSTRPINCMAWDYSGARLVAGSSDNHARLYDFGGMTVEHDPFK